MSGVDPKQSIDVPSAYIRFIDKDNGKDRGTYLVSLWFSQLRQPIPPDVLKSTRSRSASRFGYNAATSRSACT